MDQPTAEAALKRLEALVGGWALEAKPPVGVPVMGCDAASGTYLQLYPDQRPS